jgi:hypothetical protein
MAANPDSTLKSRLVSELALLSVLVFIGLAVVPLAVYLVGEAVFGEYGGGGFAAFYSDLHAQFREGNMAVWLLLLSPYVLCQLVRATAWGVRRTAREDVRGS